MHNGRMFSYLCARSGARSGASDARKLGRSDVRTLGRPDARASGRLDVRTPAPLFFNFCGRCGEGLTRADPSSRAAPALAAAAAKNCKKLTKTKMKKHKSTKS